MGSIRMNSTTIIFCLLPRSYDRAYRSKVYMCVFYIIIPQTSRNDNISRAVEFPSSVWYIVDTIYIYLDRKLLLEPDPALMAEIIEMFDSACAH